MHKNPEVCSLCCEDHGIPYKDAYQFHPCPMAFDVQKTHRYQRHVADTMELTEQKYLDRYHRKCMIHFDYVPPACPRWLSHSGGRLPKITARDKKRRPKLNKIVCRSCIQRWDFPDERLWHKHKCVDCPKRADRTFLKITERHPKDCPFAMELMFANDRTDRRKLNGI